ncbi:MAG TPA: peptide ABC transporter substrate-binding protein [Dehalococcoidia bacterium]|nr:peptide ABC transporter substrate-binding protein [Dehalococcoidia bacterium]
MTEEIPQTTDGLPVLDEADQLRRFQRNLARVKIDRRVALQVFAAAGGAAALAACGSSNNNKTANAPANNAAAKPAASAPPAAAATSAAPSGSAAAKPAASAPAAAATGGSPSASGASSLEPGPVPAGVKLAADQTFLVNVEQDASSHDFNKDLYCQGDVAIWAGLLKFNPDLKPVPDIAESWDVNADATQFTFHIRKDSKWTDGTPVTAKDFDYSFRRQLNPATKAPYASFLYDVIKNGEAYNTGKITDDSTLGIKVVDDYTLQLTTEHPAGYAPAILAYSAALPANKGAVEKFGDKWTEAANIVTNGPFKLTKWDHGVGWELAKHDGYWNAKNVHLTKVTRPIIASDAAQSAYENNEIQWTQRVGPGDYKRILGDDKLSKQVVKYFLDGTWYLVPEADKEPFTEPKVRQAMAHAVDRDSIIKNVLQGLGSPAFTFNPPGTPGFNPAKYEEFTKFDPQLAKDTLKGTKYEGGKNWPKITMTQRKEGDAEAQAGDAIIQMLGDNLGMKIDHEIGDPKEVYNRMWQRKLQLIWIRWYEDYPDANDEENLVFWSKAGGDSGHRQAWHDDNFDKLVVQAAAEPDAKKRADLYAQADQILAQQAGVIFVYYPQNMGLLKPNIGGMPKDSNGNPTPSWNIFVRMLEFLYVTA